MNFIVFPGQGSQKIGMGKDLSDNFVEAREVFEEVNESLNFDLTKIMWGDNEKDLSLTSNAQPALMACGIAAFRVLSKLTGKKLPDLANFVCGHSLGEYTAMTVAEVFSLQECSKLLRLRGDAMQKAVPVGKGAMAAFIGTDIKTVEKIIEKVQSYGICDIANDNSDVQVVISGDLDAVENAISLSKEYGIKRAIVLPVSAPFHCRLMQPAQSIMQEALDNLGFQKPLVPIVSNINAKSESDPIKLRENLINQVTGTVKWRETMLLANKLGVQKITELGSGKVLTGIAKRMIENVNTLNIENSADLENIT
ncbi:ACP S-malonyltransferase [Alphaproteobacteria bacterium]|nr:ACP S-malonyltransferase [Alphaproteobacteria bacterium]MDC0969974.1 ACP S-malonyltransferase [Alphaproteobacteria bacterium]